ncbi:MAG: wax ester/triacylglycerol synthase domain-containing protein [Candidatus Promineifilaceae bacterium]
MARRERMSSVDTAWLRMEDPTNLMMITGIIQFDEPLSYDRLISVLEQRFLIHDRFKQRVVLPTSSMGIAYWEEDPYFDIRAHVLRMALPAPGDQTALQEVVSNLMSMPLDFSKPLWQFQLVENYLGGSVLISRLHHCIADGIALVRVMLSMTDETREGTELTLAEPTPRNDRGVLASLFAPVFAAARSTQKFTEALVQESFGAIRDPNRLVDIAKVGMSGVTALGKLTLRLPDPPTPFKGDLGVIKRPPGPNPFPSPM